MWDRERRCWSARGVLFQEAPADPRLSLNSTHLGNPLRDPLKLHTLLATHCLSTLLALEQAATENQGRARGERRRTGVSCPDLFPCTPPR